MFGHDVTHNVKGAGNVQGVGPKRSKGDLRKGADAIGVSPKKVFVVHSILPSPERPEFRQLWRREPNGGVTPLVSGVLLRRWKGLSHGDRLFSFERLHLLLQLLEGAHLDLANAFPEKYHRRG